MHSVVRKTLYGAGALLVVAALVVAGVTYSAQQKVNQSPVAAQAAPDAVSAIPATQLKSILPPASAHGDGATISEMTLQEAVAGGLNEPPADMLFSPARCADGLGDGIGGMDKATGWVQYGSTSTGSSFASVAASVNEGLAVTKIRETIAACQTATVKLTSFGLTGTMKFTEFAVPVLLGAQTIGVTSTVTFPGQQIPAAAQLIVEALNGSTVYVGQGALVLETCKPSAAQALQIAQLMYARAAAQS
jgi:hypothetical protein